MGAAYLFVSLYTASRQVACVGRHCRTVAQFDALVEAAARDPRTDGHARSDLTLRLSVLENGASQHGTPPAFCAGGDALCLADQGREVILLPEVAIDENLDEQAFHALLLTKAGAAQDARHLWSALRVTCWDENRDPPSHPSFWVARHTLTADRQKAAHAWAQWLARAIVQDTLPDAILPVSGDRTGNAHTALRDAAIWRVAQVSAELGLDPSHAVPQTPVYGLLHHAARQTVPVDVLVSAVLTARPLPDARTQPEAFWLSLRALATVPDIAEHDAFAPLLARARRRLDVPALPSERLPRLATLCTLTAYEHADMREAIGRETHWAQKSVSAAGVFITAQKDIEETLITAHAAEALAMAAPLVDSADTSEIAGRCLDALITLSVRAPDRGAVVRSSATQSGAHTSHTVAALGACAAWMGTV